MERRFRQGGFIPGEASAADGCPRPAHAEEMGALGAGRSEAMPYACIRCLRRHSPPAEKAFQPHLSQSSSDHASHSAQSSISPR